MKIPEGTKRSHIVISFYNKLRIKDLHWSLINCSHLIVNRIVESNCQTLGSVSFPQPLDSGMIFIYPLLSFHIREKSNVRVESYYTFCSILCWQTSHFRVMSIKSAIHSTATDDLNGFSFHLVPTLCIITSESIIYVSKFRGVCHLQLV